MRCSPGGATRFRYSVQPNDTLGWPWTASRTSRMINDKINFVIRCVIVMDKGRRYAWKKKSKIYIHKQQMAWPNLNRHPGSIHSHRQHYLIDYIYVPLLKTDEHYDVFNHKSKLFKKYKLFSWQYVCDYFIYHLEVLLKREHPSFSNYVLALFSG